MGLQGIFDPIVKAYYKKKHGGGSFKELLEAETFSINDPSVTEVRASAFYDPRTRLTSIDLPNTTSVGDSGFYGADSLTRANLPEATYFGKSCFSRCENLVDLMIENAQKVGQFAFNGCTSLKNIYLPYVTSIGAEAFRGCESLENVVLGVSDAHTNCLIWEYAFSDCTSLSKVDIRKNVTIGENAFGYCTSLSALILRSHAICTIDLFCLTGTPAMEGTGHIYVPSDVYENYRTVYEPQIDQLVPGFFDILFRKIEDYPEICGAN
jgi:hypothetical protein